MLSRDEILAMPAGAEIDKLVAEKVMGWKVTQHDGYWVVKNWVVKTGNLPYYSWEWKPSSDIRTTWVVAEKLAKEPRAWIIESINTKDGLMWRAIYWGDDVTLDISVTASTVQLAISQASLIAVMEAG